MGVIQNSVLGMLGSIAGATGIGKLVKGQEDISNKVESFRLTDTKIEGRGPEAKKKLYEQAEANGPEQQVAESIVANADEMAAAGKELRKTTGEPPLYAKNMGYDAETYSKYREYADAQAEAGIDPRESMDMQQFINSIKKSAKNSSTNQTQKQTIGSTYKILKSRGDR